MVSSVYIHVPFCTKKCPYCHFYVIPNNRQELYIEALEREWDFRKNLLNDKKIVSLYFGGGTPALLDISYLKRIISWIDPSPDTEITLEANPEKLTPDLIRSFYDIGINRLSIGVQSLDDNMLGLLGRNHSAQDAIQCVEQAAHAGFDNISIDLMYDLPHQTLDEFQKTLHSAIKLPLSHLSLYNLQFEEGSLFFKQKDQLKKHLPSEDARFYELAIETLSLHGLAQYEISAFGRPSIHNTGYWLGRPFIGLGPSAFSYWEGRRFRNTPHITRWSSALKRDQDPTDFSEELPFEKRQRELLAINLRLLEGVDIKPYQGHQKLVDDTQELIQMGLLVKQGDRLKLTQKGLFFYDSVAESIV